MSFDVSKHIFNFCADSDQEKHLFRLHGVFGTLIIMVALLASVFGEVSWCKLSPLVRGHSRTYIKILYIIDMFFAAVAFVLFALPHIAAEPERHTGLYYYRQVALGHIIIPLRFAEQLLRIAYIWILVAVIKNDDRKKSKENKNARKGIVLPESYKSVYCKHSIKIKEVSEIVVIALLALSSSIPILMAWQRKRAWEPCHSNEQIIMLERTAYGRSNLFTSGYNKLYIMCVSYLLPAIILFVYGVMRYLDSKQEKQHKLNSQKTTRLDGSIATDPPGTDRDGKYVPEWLVQLISVSYVPIAIYASLEHLQVHGVNVGLPSVGVSYMLHLSLTILKTAVSYRWRQLRVTITGMRRENQVHSLIFPEGQEMSVKMTRDLRKQKSKEEKLQQLREMLGTQTTSDGKPNRPDPFMSYQPSLATVILQPIIYGTGVN